MADTTTSVYNFVLPEPDGSEGTWGEKLNANLESIDSILSAKSNLTNPSFTGAIDVNGSTGTAGQVLQSQGPGANAVWTNNFSAGNGINISQGSISIDSTVVTLTGTQELENKHIDAGNF